MRLTLKIYPKEVSRDKVYAGTRWHWWIKTGPQILAESKKEGHPTPETALACIDTLREGLGNLDITILK